jgi:protein-disulfide isomerase
MNKSVLVGLIVAIVIAVGVGGYIYYSGQGIGATTVPGDVSEPAAAVPTVAPDEKFIGKADAPVTMVEYFSLGCIHCKNFHDDVLPKLKTEYIDTGKARLVLRDFPLDGVAFAAAALTRCVNDLAYFAMVDTIFAQQDVWHVQGGVAQLATIAKSAGMDQAAFDACIKDEGRNAKILAIQKEGADKFKIEATPTFLVNDRKLSGVGDYETFKQTIDAALAAQ